MVYAKEQGMTAQTFTSIVHERKVGDAAAAFSRFVERRRRALVLLVGGVLLPLMLIHSALAATAPSLGTASGFAVLGATPNVNNTGPTVVTGDLGVSPAAAVVGFPPGNVIGTIHVANATSAAAQADNTTAYGALAAQACNFTFAAPTDLAGMTLVPGVYCFDTSAANTGLLKLDAAGDSAAVWIFRTSSTLTTGSASTVQMINSGQDCNVFWQVGSSATLGTATTFVGNILALTSITLQTGAALSGRALAQTGTVTLASNTVSVCSLLPPPASLPPTISVAFVPATIVAGATSTLTMTFANGNATDATLSAALAQALPAGLVFAANPNPVTTCGGSGAVTAVAGGSTLGIGAGRLIPATGSCTVTVEVTAAALGSFALVIPAGWLQTSFGSNANPASATLTVNPVATPAVAPVLSKAFSPAVVNVGAVSTLTITLSNSNATVATLSAALTDNLPAGMVVAPTPNAGTTCGGTVLAAAGSGSVSLAAGGTIPVNGSCVVTVNIVAQGAGTLVNTLAAGALQTSQGNNATNATATLSVSALPPVITPAAGIPTLSAIPMTTLVLILMAMALRTVRRSERR
jgi:hypothetical protein